MGEFADSFKYIIAMGVAWLGAHLIKFGIALARSEYKTFFLSGGMPSAHSALVVALTTLLGLVEGVTSTVFAVALALAMIVTYDAMHIRQMAAATAQELNRLRSKEMMPLVVHNGHTGLEVLAGIVLGIGIALVVFFATK